MFPQTESNPVGLSATATIPELQQSKTAVLNTLASKHSRRSYGSHSISGWSPCGSWSIARTASAATKLRAT
jgi:hypothetical protein